jgi:hypothetical protein
LIFLETFRVKAYRKDLRLKVSDAVDRRMAFQKVAYTREALDETIPDALSSDKLKYVAGWYSRCGYEPQEQRS